MSLQDARDTAVEKELSKLGWTPENNSREIYVYKDHRPNKKINPNLEWEYTIFYRTPVWKWDFVEPMTPYTNHVTGEKYGWQFKDINPEPGDWLGNNRWDFETDETDPALVAKMINEEFEREMDLGAVRDHALINNVIFMSRMPIQRVTDRP